MVLVVSSPLSQNPGWGGGGGGGGGWSQNNNSNWGRPKGGGGGGGGGNRPRGNPNQPCHYFFGLNGKQKNSCNNNPCQYSHDPASLRGGGGGGGWNGISLFDPQIRWMTVAGLTRAGLSQKARFQRRISLSAFEYTHKRVRPRLDLS